MQYARTQSNNGCPYTVVMMRLHTKVLKEAHLAVQNYLGELNNTWIIIGHLILLLLVKVLTPMMMIVGGNNTGENVNVADENAVVAWVTSIVLTYMKERLRTKPLTIRKMVLKKKTVKISYFTALRARHMCLEKIYGLGSYERSFRLVPELCHQIKASNPENIAVWSKDNTTNEFQGLCIAYKASLEGFKVGCRPLIALDGFPLKSKYRGVVLTASSVDGNNGMFPIAIYICLTGTQETWSRFLCILKPFLMESDRTIKFFSDHEKGVNVAVY
ncbi:uncharacterized protein LOC113337146 isoform X2 [Papaver somniferum]|uniref:uncharacterized protein LOC113337146 isoform X2 n=1 Tax=Papaver somniferum TaxID=3469 RepID=UPI000E6FF7DE|nr:uncharacterized protein LOC113337146 isoform X2 [Papaver somniferum]